MNPVLKYILQFIVLVVLQVLVVDYIKLGYISQFVVPSVYFLFILSLPHGMSNGLLMVLAFSIGITVDMFKSTPGMHASAMVVLAYSRPYLLKLVEPRDGFDITKNPSIYSMKRNLYFVYIGTASLLFHLWFFTIEVMRFSDFHIILLKTLLSSIASLLLIVLMQFLTAKK